MRVGGSYQMKLSQFFYQIYQNCGFIENIMLIDIRFFKIFIIIVFCCVGTFKKISSFEGRPEFLFEHVMNRDFELLENGSDSYVMKICNIDDFNAEVINAKKPVVVKFFHKEALPSKRVKEFYQRLADDYQNKVKFFSVDLAENRELITQLLTFIFKLTTVKSNLVNNPDLQQGLIGFFQNIIISDRSREEAVPFLLFFKDSSLIIPRRYKLLVKEELSSDIEMQLLDIQDGGGVGVGVTKKEKSFWNKVKGWFSKFSN